MPKRPKGETVRAHVQMPPEWRRAIDRAAKRLHVSRSSYIANAAFRVASGELVPATADSKR
jgi:uncharacterized protein (DUF1778 family)